jgi:serine/threonine-protein kinase
VRRFQREVEVLSRLNHPNIVMAHDADEDKGRQFLVMECVDGADLAALVEKNGPLDVPVAIDCILQAARGMDYAHSQGIIHRDIKPANLLRDATGIVKVSDLGVARLNIIEGAADISGITQAGGVIGSAHYMSPEQASGRPIDFRSDQFSFGSVLYEMATGRRAFKKETTPQTLAAIIEGEPVPVATLSRRLPAALVTIIEQCLAKKPERRFASTRDLASALHTVPEPRPASGIGRWALWVAAGVVALGLAGALLPRAGRVWRSLAPGRSGPAIRAIAVLPLRNLSGEAEQEYFADGMTEALITDLAQIGSLRVTSRSSAMRYKRTKAPLVDVARELGVDAVVEGSAQRVGDRVRIMAQLIDAKTDRVLWGESYERAVSDVLRLEGEVAQAIAGEIGALVTPEQKTRLTLRRTVAPAALEAYLKGEFHLYRLTPQDLETASSLFQEALAIDPDYAAAHVGIAELWSARMQVGRVPPSEAAPLALAAAQRALKLDASSSNAHLALANVRTWYEWDWKAGEAEFQQAIELNPSNARALAFHAHMLTLLGHFEPADRQMDEALKLDPLNPLFQVLAATQLIFGGRFDDGIVRLQTTFDKTPGFGIGHIPLWSALDHQGRYDEALVALKAFYATEQAAPEIVKALEQGNAEGGYKVALKRVAQALEPRSRSVGTINLVNIYDAAGDVDKALEWLGTAYERHDPNMAYVSVIPFSEKLRKDTRFQELLHRMGLPDLASPARVREAGPPTTLVLQSLDLERPFRRNP